MTNMLFLCILFLCMQTHCLLQATQGLKPPNFFQRLGLKLSQTEKLLFGEVEAVCFDVFLKKLATRSKSGAGRLSQENLITKPRAVYLKFPQLTTLLWSELKELLKEIFSENNAAK